MGLTDGAEAILWVDLETTGTDEKLDDVIEIGALLTDFEFNVHSAFTSVVQPRFVAYNRMMNNPIVAKMHTTNGLIDELDHAPCQADVEIEWLEWLLGNTEKRRFMLAGSGVSHFDRKFIAEQFPFINQVLVYPSLDIGVVRRFLRISGVPIPKLGQDDKNHRALADIRLHLEEARTYRTMIKQWYSGYYDGMVT